MLNGKSEQNAIDILIDNIIKNSTLNLKAVPDDILALMDYTQSGPSHVLSTIAVYYFINYCEKNGKQYPQNQIPFKTLMKITRDLGFLCQVERMRRKNVIDYSIDMNKLFDPETKITITRSVNFVNPDKNTIQ
jgi:hypothetical protein